MDGALKIWQFIPDGSRLTLWLESDGDEFVGSARVVTDQGKETEWKHSELHPGPASKKLRSPRDYVTRVRVAFQGSERQEVVIRAAVLKPDGTVHGHAYAYGVAGTNGDIERATIVARTQK